MEAPRADRRENLQGHKGKNMVYTRTGSKTQNSGGQGRE
jgi:hypothetical protein